MQQGNAPEKQRQGDHVSATTRGLCTAAVLIGLWWLGVELFQPAPFILPGPYRVLTTLLEQSGSLLHHAGITLLEILLGLVLGSVLGVLTALLVVSPGSVEANAVKVTVTLVTSPAASTPRFSQVIVPPATVSSAGTALTKLR